MSTLNVYALGASKNIGYYTCLRLLAAGATVTFLLRSPATFEKDETIQKYVKEGKARLVKGDGLVKNEVKHGWDEAQEVGPVDLLIFTVGGTPSFHPLKGAIVTPENLVTQCLMNVLTTMPSPYPQKIVTISSMGLTKTAHSELPLLLKPMYNYLLALPHKDKVGAERITFHCAGWQWNSNDGEPEEQILPSGWMNTEGLPPRGSLADHLLVVRPALLTDGDCKAEKENKKSYRVGEKILGGWTVSRKDVAHFIFDAVSNSWDEYRDKCISIAY